MARPPQRKRRSPARPGGFNRGNAGGDSAGDLRTGESLSDALWRSRRGDVFCVDRYLADPSGVSARAWPRAYFPAAAALVVFSVFHMAGHRGAGWNCREHVLCGRLTVFGAGVRPVSVAHLDRVLEDSARCGGWAGRGDLLAGGKVENLAGAEGFEPSPSTLTVWCPTGWTTPQRSLRPRRPRRRGRLRRRGHDGGFSKIARRSKTSTIGGRKKT